MFSKFRWLLTMTCTHGHILGTNTIHDSTTRMNKGKKGVRAMPVLVIVAYSMIVKVSRMDQQGSVETMTSAGKLGEMVSSGSKCELERKV